MWRKCCARSWRCRAPMDGWADQPTTIPAMATATGSGPPLFFVGKSLPSPSERFARTEPHSLPFPLFGFHILHGMMQANDAMHWRTAHSRARLRAHGISSRLRPPPAAPQRKARACACTGGTCATRCCTTRRLCLLRRPPCTPPCCATWRRPTAACRHAPCSPPPARLGGVLAAGRPWGHL